MNFTKLQPSLSPMEFSSAPAMRATQLFPFLFRLNKISTTNQLPTIYYFETNDQKPVIVPDANLGDDSQEPELQHFQLHRFYLFR